MSFSGGRETGTDGSSDPGPSIAIGLRSSNRLMLPLIEAHDERHRSASLTCAPIKDTLTGSK